VADDVPRDASEGASDAPDPASDDGSEPGPATAEGGVPVDARLDEGAGDDGPWERPIDRFRRGPAGSVIAAGLLGVRDALEGPREREEPAIVSEAPEPKLDHIDLLLDPEHPERSRAIIHRPPRDASSD
jgi:hypothetical protein